MWTIIAIIICCIAMCCVGLFCLYILHCMFGDPNKDFLEEGYLENDEKQIREKKIWN